MVNERQAATRRKPERHPTWQSTIDQLTEWKRNPDQLAEDELIPPTQAVVSRAMHFAGWWWVTGKAPPMRVVPDGDGGIVFERWAGLFTKSIEFGRYGQIEFVVCHSGQVVRRSEDLGEW